MSARADRRLAAAILAGSIILSATVVAVTRPAAEPSGADPITEPRICAAAAVYHLATANDWGQRAAIANAVLNQYSDGGPDCRPAVVEALKDDFSKHRWQLALDAVDAVASGSYALPPGCIRANRVVPNPPLGGTAGPALHCSMGGLTFVEVRS